MTPLARRWKSSSDATRHQSTRGDFSDLLETIFYNNHRSYDWELSLDTKLKVLTLVDTFENCCEVVRESRR